jgi:hypothetical protein
VKQWCVVLLAAIASIAVSGASSMSQFREHTIAEDLPGAYQVLPVDLNRDGRPDLIALASNMRELVWFENPTWERHVIAGGLASLINLDAYDATGKGDWTIVLATGFSMEPARSVGVISVLQPDGDVRKPWTVREIDRLPTSHRIRFADIDGSGRKVAVDAPLAAAFAASPDYRGKTPLVLYRPGVWKRELISDELEGVVHGLTITDWDGDGREEVLTASFLGIDLFEFGKDNRWTRTRLAAGNPDPWPKGGSSDVVPVRLAQRRLLAALEPWHGNQVVVYRESATDAWQRTVIDDSFAGAHALVAADVDGNGRDEVVAGYRNAGGHTYIYSAADAEGRTWTRTELDPTMPAAACAAVDLNGDGRLDVVCTGGSSLKWYENLGMAKPPL